MKQTLPSPDNSGRAAGVTRQQASLAMWLLLLSALVLLLVQRAQAQAPVVYRVGNGGTYASITQALAAVPVTLNAPYELRLTSGSTFEENVLIARVGSAANTLTIKPEAGATGVVINGTVTFGGGTRYVTLSGHNGSSARQLTVQQPGTAQPTVALTADARNITVRDARLLGNNASLAGGVVEIDGGSSLGNDDNTLVGNYLAQAGSGLLPANLVYAAAGNGSAANDRVALLSNELANYAQCGVKVSSGNGDGWIIRDNSFYYSLATAPTTAQTAISFLAGAGSDNNAVSGNYIGGTGPQAGGAVWVNAGAQDFKGVVVSCGSGTGSAANVVENNVVRNISLSQPSTQAFQALLLAGGRSELTANAVAAVTNNGTDGVNSLVSQAQTVLNSFTVAPGQVMSIQSGQTVVTGNLTIQGTLNHTGGDIIVNGDFTNSGAFAQTLGNLEVKGDLNNTGVFSCTTGGVLLTGSGPQLVGGGLYYNLEVRGAGVKTLTDDVTLANNLVMNGGVLDTGPNKIRLNADALLSETAASYVLGRVEARRTPRSGQAEIFGNVGLTLTPATGSLLPGLTTVVRTTGTAATINGTPALKRYFDIAAGVSTGLNVDMRFDYLSNELNGLTATDLRFFKSTNGGGTWEYKGISSSGAGFAQLSGVDGFSRWTLGEQNVVLPVGLTTFRAQRQQQAAVLTWSTATEENSRGFAVEVSTDGHHFRQLAFVASPTPNAIVARDYRYVDTETGKQGLRYYRLRQQDRDGRETYYGPRTVSFDNRPTLAAFPTAFDQTFDVELLAPGSGNAVLTLTDALGRVVWTQQQEVMAGPARLRVAPQCPAGNYLLTASVDGQRYQQRVVRK
ncbi:hypothetical protein [Hymenobacter jeollabukensis]|uniref:T9SS type A sorting domain-containing protein n=1 Tax=Hymenobacter jeollabukensis TaxID=2025313 RepID=A0A5R8WU97_9BACT|nr:hypothetical protein [Hymenobacter jeollabukensis]TLM95063.1 hypothetical protein FDY95_04495 [Hymenobacter jeollabukensis]